MENFREITAKEFVVSPFNLIGNEWMLITGSIQDKVNTMTASWGGLGFMWNKPVAFIVIRPQRYTKEFIEANGEFSLSIFDKQYKEQLGYLGFKSGRDENKIEKSGLTVVREDNIPHFSEAKIVINCNKLYNQALLEENFVDKSIVDKWYPDKDYHTMYIAEITKILVK